MAITITSKYTPLSYEQKIAPLVAYKEEYDSMMDKYDQLENEASKLEYIAQQYPDSDAAIAYNKYIADLDAMATEMSQGLSPGYRRNYSNIYKQYHRKITPMQQAHETILKNIENERALQAADPTRISTFTPQNIDEVIKGIQPGQTVAVSGAQLTKEAADLATMYGKALKDIDIDETAFTSIANLTPVYKTDSNGNIEYDAYGQPVIESLSKDSYRNEARYLMSKISNGLDPTKFSALISNIDSLKDTMPALYSMVTTIRTSNNYNAFNDEQKKQFDARIAQGLYSALQEPAYQLHSNPDFMGYGQPELTQASLMNQIRLNKPKGSSSSSSSSSGISPEDGKRRITYSKPTLFKGTGDEISTSIMSSGEDSSNITQKGSPITIDNVDPVTKEQRSDMMYIKIKDDKGKDILAATIQADSDGKYSVVYQDYDDNEDRQRKRDLDFYNTTLKSTIDEIIKTEGIEGLSNYYFYTNSSSTLYRRNKKLFVVPKGSRGAFNTELKAESIVVDGNIS